MSNPREQQDNRHATPKEDYDLGYEDGGQDRCERRRDQSVVAINQNQIDPLNEALLAYWCGYVDGYRDLGYRPSRVVPV
jgi:hypothetical protein